MASNVFRFDESWSLPGASPHEVWDVLARGELLPQWWRGVYLEAEKLDPGEEPRVGARVRAKARGFLPYRLNFIIEAVELVPDRLVAVMTFRRALARGAVAHAGRHARRSHLGGDGRAADPAPACAPAATCFRLEPSLDDAARRGWFAGVSRRAPRGRRLSSVIPAKAGTQDTSQSMRRPWGLPTLVWVPAFAGMTEGSCALRPLLGGGAGLERAASYVGKR